MRNLFPMIRFLAIWFIVAAGLIRPGIGLPAGQDGCGDFACRQPAVQRACCGGEVDAYCPMSNGPCECAAAPSSDPEPDRDAPLPRPERDSISALPNGPPQVSPPSGPDSKPASRFGLLSALNAGKSHNEVQALLGIWRT